MWLDVGRRVNAVVDRLPLSLARKSEAVYESICFDEVKPWSSSYGRTLMF